MDYISPAGNNMIRKWAKELSIQDRSNLETLLSILAKQKQWGHPDFKMLSGKKYAGIGEIRFPSAAGKTPLRVAGTKGAGNEYILLIGFSHKGTVSNPADALDQSVKRKKLIASGHGSICEHEEDD